MKPVLCSLMIVLLGAGFVVASEIDDSSLFVEAFRAYQKGDYLLAIERIGTINQLFPDTPLKDVTLLLLARSGLESGDNELAAKTIVQFTSEFAANPLKATVEEELLSLSNRWQKGEELPPAIPLRTAARKVRNEQLAQESSAVEKHGQELLRTEKAGPARLARENTVAERRESEPVAVGKVAREDVRASISLPVEVQTVVTGQRGEIPFEIANHGTSAETFLLEADSPPGYEATLTAAGRSDEKLSRVTIGTTTPFRGSIMFRMPPDRVDGQRAVISLRAVSERNRQAVLTHAARIIARAPLVRVVARPEKQKLAPGEQTRYRVTILNAGSLAAAGLTIRVLLPAQFEPLGPGESACIREAADVVAFRVDTLDSGKLAEFSMNVRVRGDTPIGQELRSTVEVSHDRLQRKEIFTAAAAFVQPEPAAPH